MLNVTHLFTSSNLFKITFFLWCKTQTVSAARTGELKKVINHEQDETLAYKTKIIPVFHEDRNSQPFLSNFDFCSAFEENLTPHSNVGFRHQRLIAGFAFL